LIGCINKGKQISFLQELKERLNIYCVDWVKMLRRGGSIT
jgi:hypothetical protein